MVPIVPVVPTVPVDPNATVDTTVPVDPYDAITAMEPTLAEYELQQMKQTDLVLADPALAAYVSLISNKQNVTVRI